MTYTGASVLASVGCMAFVAIVLWRRFSIIVGLLTVMAGFATSWPLARELTQTGPLRQFVIDRVMLAAEGVGAAPPCAVEKLNTLLELGARFGLATAFATLGAGILLALRGRADRLDIRSLKDRWQSIFAIYIGAMAIVACMALSTRLAVAYAASPLAEGKGAYQVTAFTPLTPEAVCMSSNRSLSLRSTTPTNGTVPQTVAPTYSVVAPRSGLEVVPVDGFSSPAATVVERTANEAATRTVVPNGSRDALVRLGDALATYAGLLTALILFVGCAPSFVSIRRDIATAAHEQSTLPDGIPAADWINANGLGVGAVKALFSSAASLAPVLVPTLAGLLEKLQNILAGAG